MSTTKNIACSIPSPCPPHHPYSPHIQLGKESSGFLLLLLRQMPHSTPPLSAF
ncbi:unnamed protein product [Chondrus crispus]|uniref:Uncharacterized protein n=1 Tax=Chondrus crispus TaxID=2769 RepID=R7QB77_CHOCR|nr:unnamed protein product [Chondrus crispus]CDF35772.1 unnamed protein product [Chondrus crispus]|eukprot:XP_005715591.1 unnamed protein product [Chondrus crispus]